jgi:septum formation protein
MKLILGSGSRSRREVLEQAGYQFEVVTADVDEKTIRHDEPEKLVLALAKAKAEAVLSKVTEPALIITADQVVVCNGQILEKPRDEAEARLFIRGYLKHPMMAVNAVVVTNSMTGKQAGQIEISKVYFKPFSESVIDEAIAIGRVMTCAGAMRNEEAPFCNYIERFEGTKDSTSGMPLKVLTELIKQVE